MPKRLGIEIDVRRAGRIRHDERRAGEVVRFTCGLIRPSKLRFPERTAETTRSLSFTASENGGERTAVADAGRASKSDRIEAQCVEGFVSPGLAVSNR